MSTYAAALEFMKWYGDCARWNTWPSGDFIRWQDSVIPMEGYQVFQYAPTSEELSGDKWKKTEPGIVGPAGWYINRPIFPTIVAGAGNWYDSQAYDQILIDHPTDQSLISIFSGMLPPTAFGLQQIGRATAIKSSDISLAASWSVSANPVIAGAGDGRRICGVDYDGGTMYGYVLYMSGNQNSVIELWTSTDVGINWTNQGPIITPTGQGRNDGTPFLGSFSFTKGNDGLFYIIYNLIDVATDSFQHKMRIAQSATREGPWTKIDGNAGTDLIVNGPAGSIDSKSFEWHQTEFIGGKYLMVVECYNGTLWQIGAFFADDIKGPWTKRPAPILSGSGLARFDGMHVATPSLKLVNTQWFLSYSGCNPSDPSQWPFSRWSIGMAQCADPTTLYI